MFTAYTSPNNTFTSVKEIAFKLGVDDTAYLGKAALKPYALVAFEFDTEPGVSQADGGQNAGRYLEFGVAPGYAGIDGPVAVPMKVGLSCRDYYELKSALRRSRVRRQHLRLLQHRGHRDCASRRNDQLRRVESARRRRVPGARRHHQVFNGGDSSRVIGSVGIGFSY